MSARTPMNGVTAGLNVGQLNVDHPLEQEFELRLRDCSTLAFRVAYSVVRHRQDAEDVAQEAFAKAYRTFHQLRDRDRFRAWLVRMTWRLALDRRRSDRRRIVRECGEEPPSAGSPADDVEAARRSAALWEAIDGLPEALRIVVVLANIQEHGLREVASMLSIPEGTVKWRLHEARKKLREHLQWLRD